MVCDVVCVCYLIVIVMVCDYYVCVCVVWCVLNDVSVVLMCECELMVMCDDVVVGVLYGRVVCDESGCV